MRFTIYIPTPRGIVLEAARRFGRLSVVPVIQPGQDLSEYGGLEPLFVQDPLDPVEVARAVLARDADGDSRSICLAFGDKSTEVASLVNAALGWDLPGYLDFVTLETFRSKSKLRRVLGEGNPLNVPFAAVSRCDEVVRFVEKIGTQAILKPADGSGSRNIVTLDPGTVSATLSAIDTSWMSQGAVVEQRVVGPEFSVEALSWNGEHSILGVTRKFTSGPPGFIETGHEFPADVSLEVRDALEHATKEILSAAGHLSGLSHTELILDDAGPKLVESHGRPGGDRISDMVGLVRGRSSFELWFDAMLTGRLPVVQESGVTAGVEFLDLTGMKSTDEQWTDRMLSLPGVVEASILLPEAERGEIVSSSTRHSLVVFCGSTDERARIRRAINATNLELK